MAKINRRLVYDKYGGHCAYCGNELDIKDMQVDHIRPKWLGGADDIKNLNPSCRMCNYYKGGDSIEVFRDWALGGLIDRLRKIFIFRVAERYGLITVNEKEIKFYYEQNNVTENEKEKTFPLSQGTT